MGAVGIGLVWAGYTIGLWGWCLVTGRNVSLGQLVSFTTWPPDSTSTSSGSDSSGSTGPDTAPPVSSAGATANTQQYLQGLTGTTPAPVPGVSSPSAISQGYTNLTGSA